MSSDAWEEAAKGRLSRVTSGSPLSGRPLRPSTSRAATPNPALLDGRRPGTSPQPTAYGRTASPPPQYVRPFVPTNFSGYSANNVLAAAAAAAASAQQDASDRARPGTAPPGASSASGGTLGGTAHGTGRPSGEAAVASTSAAPVRQQRQSQSARGPRYSQANSAPWRATGSLKQSVKLDDDEAMNQGPWFNRAWSARNSNDNSREKARVLHFWQQHMEEHGLLEHRRPARPDDGSMVGVSLKYLVELAESLEYHQALPDSTEGLVRDLIIPTVKAHQCRFVDLVPARFVGRPTYFVSHAWGGDFTELISALKAEIAPPNGKARGAGTSTLAKLQAASLAPSKSQDGAPPTSEAGATATQLTTSASSGGATASAGVSGAATVSASNINFDPAVVGGTAPLAGHDTRNSSRRNTASGTDPAGLEGESGVWDDDDDLIRPLSLAKGINAYVWIDILCLHQHGASGVRQALGKLRHMLTECACMLLVVDSAGMALTRSWCLWEVYLALHLRIFFKVLTIPGSDPEVLHRSVRALDVSKASASLVKDRAALTTELINGGCGLAEVNRLLKEGLARSNEEREYDFVILRTQTSALMYALRALVEPVPPGSMARARNLLHELLKSSFQRELSRLPILDPGEAEFFMVQQLGLFADMLDRQYKINEAKEVRRIMARVFKAYSHRFVAARFKSEMTQAVLADITSSKGYSKLAARIGKGVSPDLYNG